MPAEVIGNRPHMSIELLSGKKFIEKKKGEGERREPPGDIKYIGWDKDGTLVHQEFARVVAGYLQEKYGVPYRKSHVFLDLGFNDGLTLRDMIPDLLSDYSDGIKETAIRIAKKKIEKSPSVPFEDVPLVLHQLKNEGYRMFISSRAREFKIIKQMKRLDLLKYFEVVIGDTVPKGEESFRRAASEMGVPYEEFRQSLVYIGDFVSDGIACKRAKVAFIGRNSYKDGSDSYKGNMEDLYDTGRAQLVVNNFYSLSSQLPNLLKEKGQPPDFKPVDPK